MNWFKCCVLVFEVGEMWIVVLLLVMEWMLFVVEFVLIVLLILVWIEFVKDVLVDDVFVWFCVGFEDIFGWWLLIWVGGVMLVVVGFLIVKYLIDIGLLLFVVCVVMGLIFGIVLIVGVEIGCCVEIMICDVWVL